MTTTNSDERRLESSGWPIKIAYDAELQRPACVLLQAALGCDPQIAWKFPTESWLVELTEDLRVYQVTPKQLAVLIARAKKLDLSMKASLSF